MSETRTPEREWRFYIDDMIGFSAKVLTYSADLDQDAFIASDLNYDAVLRNLELIGEAATPIPEKIRMAHPEAPWRLIIATRNQLIHAYLGIEPTSSGASFSKIFPTCYPYCGN
jgi:uncharacterized protein with HEPN domain